MFLDWESSWDSSADPVKFIGALIVGDHNRNFKYTAKSL